MKPKAKLSNDEAEELIRQGWSSPENTALLKERMDELQARADRAEVCCAEMRELLVLFRTAMDRLSVDLQDQFDHALHATDCGKGWLSPQRAAELYAIHSSEVVAKVKEFEPVLKAEMEVDGWLSPEKAKAMQDTIDEDVRHLAACSAALAREQARNQRLTKALEKAKTALMEAFHHAPCKANCSRCAETYEAAKDAGEAICEKDQP